MSRRLLSVLPCALALSACVELNPARPPPDHAVLARGGVWVAYNLGCEQGCEQIRRGDRILAVDGRPVTSGAEVDTIARGEPVVLRVAKYGRAEVVDVTIVAEPNDRLPPIPALPPLITVGTAALDRAPEWARSKLFGHAIPAILFYLADSHGYVNGRQLFGQAALIVVWELPVFGTERWASARELMKSYAHLQAFADQLRRAGVSPFFVTDVRKDRASLDDMRRLAEPGETGFVPIVGDASRSGDPTSVGLEGQADLRAVRFNYVLPPVVIILDRRGIVRFHSHGSPAGVQDTLTEAIEFALHALPESPRPAAPQLIGETANSSPIRVSAR